MSFLAREYLILFKYVTETSPDTSQIVATFFLNSLQNEPSYAYILSLHGPGFQE